MRVGRVWGHFLALRVWLSVLPCASLNLALVSSYTGPSDETSFVRSVFVLQYSCFLCVILLGFVLSLSVNPGHIILQEGHVCAQSRGVFFLELAQAQIM